MSKYVSSSQKWRGDCWAIIFHSSENTGCTGTTVCRLEEQKKKTATKDVRQGKNDEEQNRKMQNGRTKTVGRSVHGWRLIVKKRGSSQKGRTRCSNGTLGCWLHEGRKKDEEKRREEEHHNRVDRMISSAEGGARFLHRITKPAACRGGFPLYWKTFEEYVKPMRRCAEKKKVWAKDRQCDSEVQGRKDKPWGNEELRSLEEGFATDER